MIVNNTGCALCNSTWGNYYQTIENTKLFFCCEACANIFNEIIVYLKRKFEIVSIDKIGLQGNPRYRNFVIFSNKIEFKGKLTFSNKKILECQVY